MEIKLITYTDNAQDLLILTKRTRRMDVGEILNMSEEEKQKELEYVFKTIPGPWEFVDYVFFISGVTRAFTHQLVRHRVGTSFAQESLRIVDKSEFEHLDESGHPAFSKAIEEIKKSYSEMLVDGVDIQKARGVLPTNILTSIIMKINLRALNNMMNVRLCVRASGEFQRVAKEIRRLVLSVHPWAEPVLLPFCMEWGVCRFQNFDKCPIKLKYPFLQKKDSKLLSEAKMYWQQILGFSPQPK